jgi:REP element-mobilizing transposase RayT
VEGLFVARLARAEVIDPGEIAIAHVVNRVVRRCFLMGDDPVSGKNFDHRKVWIEELLEHFAACFGIDLISYAILSNHYHLVLRSRPDVVKTWSDEEVARRWLMICPLRKVDGKPATPSQAEIDLIRHCPVRLAEIRGRLSNISWWVRLLNQRIAQRSNREDEKSGRFWEDRFRLTKLIDEESLLACMVYVDLNPIRAAMAERLEESDFTSVQRRIQAEQQTTGVSETRSGTKSAGKRRDALLAKLTIDPINDPVGASPSETPDRCSDKGVLELSTHAYLELADWTARQVAPGKRGRTPEETPPVLQRLGLRPKCWCELMDRFEDIFIHLAGRCDRIDAARSHQTARRFRVRPLARTLLPSAA